MVTTHQETAQHQKCSLHNDQMDRREYTGGLEERDISPTHVYPEGRHGWLVVVATFIVCFWNIGLLVSCGVFKEFLINHQIFPKADIQELSWIGAIGICTLYLVAPPVAILTKPLGIRPIWCIGVVIASGGFLASSFATKVWHLYLTFGVLFGAGSGILYFASLVVLSQYFYKRRGLAAGLGGAGAGVGTIVLAPVWRLMCDRLGFPWTLRIIAAAMFVSLCFVFIFIRPRNTQVRTTDNSFPLAPSISSFHQASIATYRNEADIATVNSMDTSAKSSSLPSLLLPLSTPPIQKCQLCQQSNDHPAQLHCVPPTSTSDVITQGGSRAHDRLALDVSLLREPRFMLLWTISFIFMCGYLVPFFLVPTYATSIGISSSKAASLISIGTASSLVSRIVLGTTGDRMGVLNTSLACFVISSLSCFALWYPAHDYLLLVVFMFMYGVFAGGLFILLPVTATQIVGQERLPMALGITFVANALGGLVGSPISDAVVKASGGDNWWAILFTGLTLVVSTALCAALRFTTRRSI